MASRYEAVHKTPNGPGDARPTASQIIEDEGLTGQLSDKVILITGCSSGIGVETARVLYTTGATLYLTARDLAKAKTALGDLADSPRVHLLALDLESLDSVRACAASFLSQSSQLNIFVANAGVMNTPEGRTKDGFETQFGTNHLSHFLLVNLLAPTLISSASPTFNSRAVVLSSVAHRWGGPVLSNINFDGCYEPTAAYSASKTYNLWTANEIERRYGSQGLHAWSVQPGGIMTALVRHLSQDALDALAEQPTLTAILKSVEQGAATTVWAATAKALEGKGGRYLEDCGIAKEWKDGDGVHAPGYASYAYDVEGAGKLWAMSLELTGLPAEK